MLAHALTGTRLLLAAAFAAVAGVWGDSPLAPVVAGVLCVLAVLEELTDLFDGLVARRRGTAGVLGGILDPLSDSLSRLTIYFAMALSGWIHVAVPLIMTGRDIIVAYTRIAHALTGGKTSARISGKLKAIIQGGGIVVVVIVACFPDAGLWGAAGWLRVAALVIIGGVTLWSLADYLFGALRAVVRLNRLR